MKLGSLYIRGQHQAPLGIAQTVDFALDHSGDGLRELVLDFRKRFCQMPDAVVLVLSYDPLVPQIAQKVGHEERAPLGLRVNEGF